MPGAKIAIIMGSDSDLPVMQDAANILEEFDVDYEITIVSAHRTPERMFDYAKKAALNNFKVIIAGAGGSAHLPGMVAALTHLPVIGVPVQSKSLSGVDSLYSIVQMPPGVPVATVAINGAKNAGLLAIQILAISDKMLADKFIEYKHQMKTEIESKAHRLEETGVNLYLKEKN
jgi:5-(carboxyamino)imidazole ribonucleotide mutase